jgi:hypothetical protein
MSGFRRGLTGGFYNAFYWLGILTTVACFALVLAGNTEVLWRFEHVGFPISWAFGAIAVLAFTAVEVCSPPPNVSTASEEEFAPSPDWEALDY